MGTLHLHTRKPTPQASRGQHQRSSNRGSRLVSFGMLAVVFAGIVIGATAALLHATTRQAYAAAGSYEYTDSTCSSIKTEEVINQNGTTNAILLKKSGNSYTGSYTYTNLTSTGAGSINLNIKHDLTVTVSGSCATTGKLTDNMNGASTTTSITIAKAGSGTVSGTLDQNGNVTDNGATPSCENSGLAVAWIMCAMIDWLADAVNGTYSELIEPLLYTPSIATGPIAKPLKTAWSSFRDIADGLLVIALLVMIYGESVGGGIFSSYTVKKTLPRILAAAIFINLSYYLVEIAIDVSNIIGVAIGNLIEQPFGLKSGTGYFHFDLSTQSGAQQVGGTLAAGGTVISATYIGALFVGSVVADGGAVALLIGALTSILLPLLLIFLAIAATLLIRIAIIFALVMAAPFAFAMYALPNTEQYFQRWWKMLQETLMVYPIIAVMFALSAVLSQTTIWASTNSDTGIKSAVAFIIALILLVLPLLFIPFAFKLAGGIVGKIHDLADGSRQKVQKTGFLGNLRDRNKQRVMDHSYQGRQRWRGSLKDREGELRKNGHSGRAGVYKMLGSLNNAGNLNSHLAEAQAREAKKVNDMIASGIDTEVRGLTVSKQAALAVEAEIGQIVKNADGTWVNQRTGQQVTDAEMEQAKVRTDSNGIRQFQSLGGAWIDENDVDNAQSSLRGWKNNKYVQQAALSYEMRKTNTDGQRENLRDNYRTIADSWGMSSDQRNGAWIGAAFENQNNNLQFKYVQHKDDGSTDFNSKGFVQEVFEKRGSYAMSNMDASTIRRLTESVGKDGVDQNQLKEIAKTMQDRMAGAAARNASAVGGVQPTGKDGALENSAASMGAGHVAQEMDRFVRAALGPRADSAENR